MNPFLVPIVAILACAAVALGLPLVRGFVRRMERDAGQPRVPQDVADRLARMEQAIDTVAVEIERISEAQRFTTRLLTDRAQEPRAALPPTVPSVGPSLSDPAAPVRG